MVPGVAQFGWISGPWVGQGVDMAVSLSEAEGESGPWVHLNCDESDCDGLAIDVATAIRLAQAIAAVVARTASD